MEELTLEKCLKYAMAPEIRHLALLLIKRFHEFVEEKGLVYWATGGTIIGLVLHKTMVPWDDDFDIVIYRSDYSRAESILKEFCILYPEYRLRKFTWGPNNSGFKIEPLKGIAYFLDIFISIEIRDNNEECICTKSQTIDNLFKKKDLFNPDGSISIYPFGYGYIRAAHTLEAYLDRFYKNYHSRAPIYNHIIPKRKNIIYSLSEECLSEINTHFKELDTKMLTNSNP